jgi:hypothetical protein
MEKTTLAEAETKPPSSISTGATPPSGSPDLHFPVTLGFVISCRLREVEGIRGAVEREGGRIVFQTTSEAPLFLLRQRQVERILQGDISALAEVHRKKQKGSEKI